MPAPTTMKAVAYTSYGGPEVTKIIDVPVPTPKAGEVQIRVVGAGLNPVDARIRDGSLKMLIPLTLPSIAGNELSGTISALGDGVASFAVGDNVVVRLPKTSPGAVADYTVTSADVVAHAPKNIPLADAAGLPLAGLTALQALDKLNVVAGDKILITAGAGGVGLFAIQLAKIRGAHVTTTASSAGADLVRSVGADVVVDYKTTKLADLGVKFDKVFDAAGGDLPALQDVFKATNAGGSVFSIAGPPTPSIVDSFDLGSVKYYVLRGALWLQSRGIRSAAAAAGVSYEFFFMKPDGPELKQLVEHVDAGKLRIVVDSTYTVADYADAFARLESKRSKGKVIVELPGAEARLM